MSEILKAWETLLKENGFTDQINPEHWEDRWAERRHYKIHGTGQRILEITRRNTYLRIVETEGNLSSAPFSFREHTSIDYPRRPKTDFYLADDPPIFLTETEVEKKIEGVLQMK